MADKTEYLFLNTEQGNCITLYVERGTNMATMIAEFRKIGFALI